MTKKEESAMKRALKLEAEKARVEQMCEYEKEYGVYSYICGIDEAGRGPLAGPVVAGAVILPKDCRILYINDSKKLSAKKREARGFLRKGTRRPYSAFSAADALTRDLRAFCLCYLFCCRVCLCHRL